MYVIHALITLTCCTISLLGDQDCGTGRYYDPITDFCHPCTDCSDGRSGNIYCENECKGRGKCRDLTYYDPHTQLCHPCSDCHPSRDPNEFCLRQCKVLTPSTTTAVIATDAADVSSSVEKILTIVVPVLLVIIVTVLIAVGVYVCVIRRCYRTNTNAVRETVLYHPAADNGPEELNGISIIAPSPVDRAQSLPATVNSGHVGIQGRIPNSSSDTWLMNEHPASNAVLHGEETMPLQQAASPNRSFIHLEESDEEFSHGRVLRRSSSRLHSSLLGNPVCHPEQEDHATIAPTLVMAAAEPHVSLDPDKPCCQTTNREYSSMTSSTSDHSVSETFRKSSR